MGRRKKSEYGRAYNRLQWNEALHQQYAQISQYRLYRKAREFRHEPFVWDDSPDDDSSSLSSDCVGVPQVETVVVHDRQDAQNSKTEIEKNSECPSDSGQEQSKYSRRLTEARSNRRVRKRSKRSGGDGDGDVREQPKTRDRKPPFHPYGWANNAVGSATNRKTYNVNASEEEVFPSALRALKRRQADEHIREELRQRRSLEIKRLQGAFNLGDIRREKEDNVWLTEYQRSYSGTPKPRHVTLVS